jgi:hypothetical protein
VALVTKKLTEGTPGPVGVESLLQPAIVTNRTRKKQRGIVFALSNGVWLSGTAPSFDP